AASLRGFDKVIALGKASVESYYNRAVLNLCAGNFKAAASDLRICCDRVKQGRTAILSRALLLVASKELGENSEVPAELASLKSSASDPFARVLASYLSGSCSRDALIQKAATDTENAQAHLFAGICERLNQKFTDAKTDLEWVRDKAELESD